MFLLLLTRIVSYNEWIVLYEVIIYLNSNHLVSLVVEIIYLKNMVDIVYHAYHNNVFPSVQYNNNPLFHPIRLIVMSSKFESIYVHKFFNSRCM